MWKNIVCCYTILLLITASSSTLAQNAGVINDGEVSTITTGAANIDNINQQHHQHPQHTDTKQQQDHAAQQLHAQPRKVPISSQNVYAPVAHAPARGVHPVATNPSLIATAAATTPGSALHVAYVGSSHAGSGSPSQHIEQQHRSSFNLLSEAMSQAVSNEFNSLGAGSADGACHVDDIDCFSGNVQDRLGMEAIASLHRQLDDDDNGNIDLSESDDFLREELKYDSGYEKRQKAFHFNDDMHISVKELWEAWLRSEVHNWTIEQTTDWLAQSVQLPQYVELFKLHKVTGASLPRLAVNNLHYVSNVLGIKDPIHKQKISLKAMDVVLFGPPRETGTRWKDYILVTLLLSAIIGCWYAYQQNKNAKRHLRRMAQDMEGLQRAEQSLQEMQKELERARMEQENVATEKMDLERRLKEAPPLTSSSSDLEVQQLKKEIEILRNELSRAEFELVDNCWAPPPQLQSWLQYTYELENKNHQKKRASAEKQLQSAREACEKLRKKRSSLVGAFVSTHGKSIDDVDRSIVEARNALGEVTNELQERLHRWKQIETCLGINIVNNNGLPYLESVLYGRNGGMGGASSSGGSTKGSRARITSSTDDLDDESVQGLFDNYNRNPLNTGSILNSNTNTAHDDSSCSEDGVDNQSVQFYLGTAVPSTPMERGRAFHSQAPLDIINMNNQICTPSVTTTNAMTITTLPLSHGQPATSALSDLHHTSTLNDRIIDNSGCESQHSPSASSERSIAVPPRAKKHGLATHAAAVPTTTAPICLPNVGRVPLPPPRKSTQSSQMLRSQSTDLLPMEIYTYLSRPQSTTAATTSSTTVTATAPKTAFSTHSMQQQHTIAANNSLLSTGTAPPQQYLLAGGPDGMTTSSAAASWNSGASRKMVKQHSTASQKSTSSTSSSVQSAPPNADCYRLSSYSSNLNQSPARWPSHEHVTNLQTHSGGYGGNFHGVGYMHQGCACPINPASLSNANTGHGDGNEVIHQFESDNATEPSNNGALETGITNNNNNGRYNNNITSTNKLKHLQSQLAVATAPAAVSENDNKKTNIGCDVAPGIKKRKRRLRFPFGSSFGGNNDGSSSHKSSSNESGKSKLI